MIAPCILWVARHLCGAPSAVPDADACCGASKPTTTRPQADISGASIQTLAQSFRSSSEGVRQSTPVSVHVCASSRGSACSQVHSGEHVCGGCTMGAAAVPARNAAQRNARLPASEHRSGAGRQGRARVWCCSSPPLSASWAPPAAPLATRWPSARYREQHQLLRCSCMMMCAARTCTYVRAKALHAEPEAGGDPRLKQMRAQQSTTVSQVVYMDKVARWLSLRHSQGVAGLTLTCTEAWPRQARAD